jgi:ribonuclease D
VNDGPLRLIEDGSEFAALLRRLRAEPLIAVDTEAASFHRHRDRVYLVQLSTRGETHLVDPLAVTGLPGLGDLLADTAVEKVFHDADYDLRLLGSEFGFRAANLFDTRVAAQFLNEPGIGLAAMLEKHVGVTPDKRFQRADWSARPLSQPMLEYAAMDTRHLPELRDLLRDKLVARGRLEWVKEECELLTQVRWPDPVPTEIAALGVKGTRAISPRAATTCCWRWRSIRLRIGTPLPR